MPVKRTTKGGRPAYKYGPKGKAYTYKPGDKRSRSRAKHRAYLQGRAIKWSQKK